MKARYYYSTKSAKKLTSTLTLNDLPVDPLTLINNRGIYNVSLLYTDIGEEDGFAVKKPKTNEYRIFLSNKYNNIISRRCCFTESHEIAHIQLRHFVDFDINRLSKNEKDILDKEANAAAAEIIMPERFVYKLYQEGYDIYELAHTFDVSLEAMKVRLNYLNLAEYKLA